MKPEAQRIAIAEVCGWVCNNPEDSPRQYFNGQTFELKWETELPDYLNDLNAMHEAEKVLSMKPEYIQKHAFNNYAYLLIEMCKHQCNAVHATAAQRAEAFLRTLGKWEED